MLPECTEITATVQSLPILLHVADGVSCWHPTKEFLHTHV